MKNLQEYNQFVQSLEKLAEGVLFFHRINHQIYITSFRHRLLGVWDITEGEPVNWKN